MGHGCFRGMKRCTICHRPSSAMVLFALCLRGTYYFGCSWWEKLLHRRERFAMRGFMRWRAGTTYIYLLPSTSIGSYIIY
ncbi:hypothetical protein FPV67DRAFT_1511543 [Lyophyllum atratum]|nr:hypothetical protein FPV67DRAFT_1511543 [Lyophyllum atratum]